MKYLWFFLALGRSDKRSPREFVTRVKLCDDIPTHTSFDAFEVKECPPRQLSAKSPFNSDVFRIDVDPRVYREGSTGLVYRSLDRKWILKVPKTSAFYEKDLVSVCRE